MMKSNAARSSPPLILHHACEASRILNINPAFVGIIEPAYGPKRILSPALKRSFSGSHDDPMLTTTPVVGRFLLLSGRWSKAPNPLHSGHVSSRRKET